ncbi:tetratricopeptide repeat protein [Gottschalkiaceae bacterium SANA]|nr:tetratricopeptide repeat protein [Gottschalkiaceae bacterium SANA]
MEDILNKAIKLREIGELEKANTILVELTTRYPNHAVVNYQCAWSFDVLGLEKEAIPYYEKAIELGLPEKDLKEAYLGLGSTYRTIGEYDKSKKLLLEGIDRYENNGLKVFLSMALYNLGEHTEAMRLLLSIIAETSADESVITYKKAIEYYSIRLDEVWE